MAENPNIPLTYSEQALNRAYETRRDNDTFRTPAITLYDIDYAIMYYLKNEINCQIEQNDEVIDVPIVYASAEIWSQLQGKGYLRDKQGKILAPYGVIRRTSMSEDERFRKLDVNNAPVGSNLIISPKYRNFENIRDKHRSTQNSNFADEYYISVMPEFYRIEYELTFFTYYIEQMNKIVQDVIPTSNFVWGDSYKFRTLVGDVSFEDINPSNSERLVKCSMPLTVDGRLQSEFELRKSTIQKAYSIKRVVFRTEHSAFDINAVENFPNERPKTEF
jgi:hypothetical protein